ncbi:hypothetical protein N7478_013298 [Penicillium angulare]|uniref:uncharacterized protein n=1 Tax=Penicillium angulare TaxID=116970 RepID=UPI00254100C1|nr:uncharacterized protein N7478_013298 [Penicillium angulare]KAJ5257194.1 hypothetical protein N7478_013298 [Penicillium angulare]
MGYSKGEMIALGFVFVVLATVFVALRIWARRLRHASLGADDYAIFAGWAFTIAVCAVHLEASIHGQLGQHQATYPDGEPILDDPRFIVYEKCKFALHMLSVLGLGFTKISVVLLYRRIFQTPGFQRVCLVYIYVVVAWTISFFFACLFQCTPVTPFVEGFYGNKCTNVIVLYNVVSGSDVALDVLIIILPIQPVIKVNMSLKQRLMVLGMFLLGLLAVACSIARLVSFVQCDTVLIEHYNDETYYTSGVFVWTVVELVMAVISACLPTLRPLFMIGKKDSNSSGQYRSSYGSEREQKKGYMRSTGSRDDDYEIPVLASRNVPSVQCQTTPPSTSHARPRSSDEGIYVQQSFSWTNQDTLGRHERNV